MNYKRKQTLEYANRKTQNRKKWQKSFLFILLKQK